MKLVALIKLGRPLFLVGGFVMYALGAVIAGVTDWPRYVLGQATVTALQWMTHYANDYFDYDADRANESPTRWSGGSRVLVAGELPRGVAVVAALVLAAAGLGFGATLGLRFAPLVGAIAVLAWEYSAPPLRLCARGAGELATAAVVCVLVPWLGFAVQGGGDARLLAMSIVTPALLQLAMMLAIEFPDAAGDAASGKRTVIVRIGAARGARLYQAITLGAYIWLPIAYVLGLPARVVLLALAPVPIAVWRIARAGDYRDPSKHERMTFFSVALLVATASVELVAWLGYHS